MRSCTGVCVYQDWAVERGVARAHAMGKSDMGAFSRCASEVGYRSSCRAGSTAPAAPGRGWIAHKHQTPSTKPAACWAPLCFISTHPLPSTDPLALALPLALSCTWPSWPCPLGLPCPVLSTGPCLPKASCKQWQQVPAHALPAASGAARGLLWDRRATRRGELLPCQFSAVPPPPPPPPLLCVGLSLPAYTRRPATTQAQLAILILRPATHLLPIHHPSLLHPHRRPPPAPQTPSLTRRAHLTARSRSPAQGLHRHRHLSLPLRVVAICTSARLLTLLGWTCCDANLLRTRFACPSRRHRPAGPQSRTWYKHRLASTTLLRHPQSKRLARTIYVRERIPSCANH